MGFEDAERYVTTEDLHLFERLAFLNRRENR
jgi:hypothetical protein